MMKVVNRLEKSIFPESIVQSGLLYNRTTTSLAGDEFHTMDDAAVDFAWTYIDDSKIEKKEYGASIYKNENGTYSYTTPSVGGKNSVLASVHQKLETEASIHTHTDLPNMGVPSYLVTADGDLIKFDPLVNTGNCLDNYSPIAWSLGNGNNQKDPTISGLKNIKDHVQHFVYTGKRN